MRKYKYSIGDYVKFKSKFTNPTCGLVGREGTVAKITGYAYSYNNKPHYYINKVAGEVFPESCFAGLVVGLASEASKNSLYRDEAIGADTLQGSELSCDTEENRIVLQ